MDGWIILLGGDETEPVSLKACSSNLFVERRSSDNPWVDKSDFPKG